MPWSYTLLIDKDNDIQRNRRHLESNFLKTENDNDMDNDTEIEPITKHSTWATEPWEVDTARENAEKHQATQLDQEEE